MALQMALIATRQASRVGTSKPDPRAWPIDQSSAVVRVSYCSGRTPNSACWRPSSASLPIAANSGSLGAAVNGTNMWGVLAGQAGPPYAGFGLGNKAILNDGLSGGYLGLPSPAALNISGNITLMAWIKPTDRNYFRDIIAHGWFVPLVGQGSGPTDYQETFLRIGRGPRYGTGTFYEVGATDGGGKVVFPVTKVGPTTTIAIFSDPDGNIIGLTDGK